MATVTEPIRGMCDPVSFVLRRLTVEQYHDMIENGIITEDDNVELLEGYLVPTDGHSPAHDGPIMVLEDSMRPMLAPRWTLRVQMPVTLDVSEPEPDVAVVRAPARTYFQRHPGPADIGQLVEVSDTTLAKDRQKGVIYARNRIPVYWIVNIPDCRVEVYTDPSGPDALPAYRQRHDFGRGESVPVVIDGQALGAIPVDDLLP
jgi:Uma2 family endonuclease